MRFLFAVLLWLLSTAALAITVTAAWAQVKVVDENGYVALVAPAADDPNVQRAIADELTTQIVSIAKQQGRRVTESSVADIVGPYTSGPQFRTDFESVNRTAHQWLFTNSGSAQRDSQGRWQLELAPMIKNIVPQGISIKAPDSVKVSLSDESFRGLTPGRLTPVSRFGAIAVWVAAGVTFILVGLTQLAVRNRSKGVAALGVSALIVGAAGWAGLEIGRARLDKPLGRLTTNVHQVADGLLNAAVGSAHTWLSLTMVAGGALILVGVAAAALGVLLRP